MNKTPKTGLIIAVIILAFVGAALGALLFYAPDLNVSIILSDPYYRHVTSFSFFQAFLSTLISVGLAVPVGHALSRRNFRGKPLLLRLFSMTLVLPVLVGIFGLLALYGNSGLLSQFYQWLGSELPFSIYGLNGILLAHVFFNLPYASRLLLQSLEGIPQEQHKLCAHLGMSHWHKFRWVEWPRLRQQLPHVCGLVFMLCFTSFATVMALGGGPKSTTIELAVYQAIKFDFDLQSGAVLALWQMLLCSLLVFSLQKLTKPLPATVNSAEYSAVLSRDNGKSRCWDFGWIGLSVLLVLPPLLIVLLNGVNHQTVAVLTNDGFWTALAASLRVALLAAVIAVSAGMAVLWSSRILRMNEKVASADRIELIGTIILVTPGLVISTGLFLLLRNVTNVFSLAVVIVIAVNALMALPYVIKTLAQPMLQLGQQYHLLCSCLGIRGWNRLRLIEWRALRKPFAHAFAVSFMLSMGDLSAIALFGSQDFRTLPLYLYQLLGSYQMEAAAVVSLCMLLINVSCFTLIEKLFTRSRKTL
ncbi:thiamine/thiamine pyrophosphate ABC transporter permease ThiP [Vibrio sp. HA2012]|uniref:thiamine/thiamine pyrophosphate ABC transporter permease ThiP n=1 Tax=Vibrio sp. HA2012 TaxID=1971595 RepID=UPI000C2C23C1|nr:thiamine/thiamine pyrophosphate ABC transporter permease ThiP [Vibrio sp. HA2012]PJC85785.1 thiamine/thiamine pyrophosphate ABC transporter permease ThiP [Vibrio sp. HA2012]